MATVLKTPTIIQAPFTPRTCSVSSKSQKPFCVSFRHSTSRPSPLTSLRFSHLPSSLRFVKFVPFSSSGETDTTETQTQEEVQEPQQQQQQQQQQVQDDNAGFFSLPQSRQQVAPLAAPQFAPMSPGVLLPGVVAATAWDEPAPQDIVDGAAGVEDVSSDDDVNGAEEVPASAIVSSLQLYKEALASNDESGVAEIESFLKSIEEEKISLERKVASLSEELLTEKERILRISADFDNFRKRTERDRLSLLTNAQGEVVESLLPVLDNFERAKTQIKVETEGEEKINNSYQSISKQFIEILNSLGVVPVETVGNPFDPLLHEAIMREDSNEYEEGIIIQEFRKGFKLGDRLLRPSMVKVSAGPGPAKPEEVESTEGHDTGETTEEGTAKSDST
uniref:GrpE protein homolog n=1 Tax=Quercus lobata TaxID=97700 RepID=A0A7N2R7I8_QUELO